MGNSPSSNQKANGAVPPPSRQQHGQSPAQPSHQQRPSQSSSYGAPPSLNHVSSTAQPSASFESASAETVFHPRSSASHVLRSQSAGSGAISSPAPPSAPVIRPQESSATSPKRPSSASPAMGQTESRLKKAAASAAEGESARTTPPAAKPIDAPAVSGSHLKKGESSSDQNLPSDEESYVLAASEFSRPPRLPLPIGDQRHTPGSPIISPADVSESIEPIDQDIPIVSRSSVLSSTTVDEEDIGDDLDTVRGGVLPPVPTVVEWREKGNKVYVTGTFADWDRKYRLLKNGPIKEKDVLSTVINLQPGTYHLRFIVDGDMVLSRTLPTAVDFTNSLVNYIEVVPKDALTTAGLDALVPEQLQQAGPSQPVSIANPTANQKQLAVPLIHPPLTLPPTPELGPIAGPSSVPIDAVSGKTALSPSKPLVPQRRYARTVPQFFLDTDADEGTPEYYRTLELSSRLPAPPSLPSFLSKSILNMATPHKDDASVLANPNHTVLNHLTTSSIKNGVIATSATTRYRRKFLTTIYYKPTHLD